VTGTNVKKFSFTSSSDVWLTKKTAMELGIQLVCDLLETRCDLFQSENPTHRQWCYSKRRKEGKIVHVIDAVITSVALSTFRHPKSIVHHFNGEVYSITIKNKVDKTAAVGTNQVRGNGGGTEANHQPSKSYNFS
jgi:hypothetical protein